MTVTRHNFEQILEKSWKKPVLVDFWAPWCGPCRMLSPVIEQLVQEAGDSAVVGKVNVDEETELSERFGVYTIPTIIVFRDGQIDSRTVGYRSLSQLKQLIGIE